MWMIKLAIDVKEYDWNLIEHTTNNGQKQE
jgi:hypothetical protein